MYKQLQSYICMLNTNMNFTMLIKDITNCIESFAPLSLQEEYDNSGLLIGHPEKEIKGILICVDVTETVLEEAICLGCDLIIAHHPLIFKGIRKLTGYNSTERIVEQCILKGIALYAAHTNLDNTSSGVNAKLSEILGLQNCRILKPTRGMLRKIVTFCPSDQAEKVRQALFKAGAGHIGNYDNCSFNTEGSGTFRALENANPFIGSIDELHFENEIRIETIFPSYNQSAIVRALLASHPYEEVAYDIYRIENEIPGAGSGMIGELSQPENEPDFLQRIKELIGGSTIRHTAFTGKQINQVALCGGSGSFLIKDALLAGADIFITGDIKYHDFFLAEGQILLADIGHYESEQFTKELLFTLLTEKFPNFAVLISKSLTNPIIYL
jgi:dinuclear metal center YbgI/SA1388 family protein